MSTSNRKNPTYQHRKQSGQARVTLPDGQGGRKDFLLGKYNTAASRAEYDRLISWWIGNGRRIPRNTTDGMTVNEVILAYFTYCQTYHRDPDGKPTHEICSIKNALRPLKELFGATDAAHFDSLSLKTVRRRMIDAGLCRKSINKQVARVKACFHWAAEEKLVPAGVFHEVQTVRGLRAGRSDARETEEVQPVPVEDVEATLPYLPAVVGDMVRLQLATGMRAGELVIMRGADTDRTGTIWLYHPTRHKSAHRGHKRTVAIGPKAQLMLRKYLTRDPEAFLFSPRESVRLFRADQREKRKTRVQPSQRDRRKKSPRKKAGDRYVPAAYARSISNGIQEAARLMGYTMDGRRPIKKAVDMLQKTIEDGNVACESLSRNSHIFSREDFPAEVHDELRPN